LIFWPHDSLQRIESLAPENAVSAKMCEWQSSEVNDREDSDEVILGGH